MRLGVLSVTRVLILGGTGDARRLAALAADAGFEVVSSLAGRTSDPVLPSGDVRVGGFGGTAGLDAYLRTEHIDVLIDATHPFADQISQHAASAARAVGIPRLLLDRPAWELQPGDRWIPVPTIEGAAAALPGLASRVLLTIGRQELAAFAGLDVWCLFRMIEPPSAGSPQPRGQLLLDRGPFIEDRERQLLMRHEIEAVVTRNSGGDETYPKIAAARSLGVPVVIIERPPVPPGDTVATPDEALAWLRVQARVSSGA